MVIKRKPVAFNESDPDQRALLEFAEKRTNFSAYIKRLIQRDMEGGAINPGVMVPISTSVVDPGLDDDLMGGLV